MADCSPPSTPDSFKTTFSSLPALDSHSAGRQDVKRTTVVVHSSRKMSDDSSSPVSSPGPTEKGKNAQMYAPMEELGEGSGGAEGGEGEELRSELMSVVIATVRGVELRLGAQALIAGRPLVGILEMEGGIKDSVELPEVAPAMPEDIGNGEELEEEEENVSPPAPPPDEGVRPRYGTKEELLDEHQPEYDLGDFFPEEFDTELERLKEPAFQYGVVEREEELEAEEQHRKAQVRAKLRIERQRIHDKTWEEYVARGRRFVDEQRAAGTWRPTRPYNVNPGPPAVNLAGGSVPAANVPASNVPAANVPAANVPPANTPQGNNPQPPTAVPVPGKEKISPRIKRYLKKYGGKLVKMGFKFGMDIAEDEVENALGFA